MKALKILALTLVLTVSATASAKDSLGEQKVAVFLIDLLQDGKAQSSDEIKKAVFSSQYSVANFIKEASYERAHLTGDVFGWFQPMLTDLKCDVSMEELYQIVGAQVDYQNYDRWIIFYHLDDERCTEAGLGHSTFGKEEWSTPKGKVKASVSWVNGSNRIVKPALPYQNRPGIAASVIAHELGHALGIRGHSNLYDCGDETISLDLTKCKQEAIADTFSLMGGEGVFRNTLHYNACHKEELGWFSENEIARVNLSQPQLLTIDLHPFASNKGKVMTIKIPLTEWIPVVPDKGVMISHLFLTYRTDEGFDRRLTLLEQSDLDKRHWGIFPDPSNPDGLSISTDGIQIRGGFYLNNHCVTTYLLDMKPSSIGSTYENKFYEYSLYDALDGFLTIGNEFTEPYNNISIKVLHKNNDGSLTIQVQKP